MRGIEKKRTRAAAPGSAASRSRTSLAADALAPATPELGELEHGRRLAPAGQAVGPGRRPR